MWSGWVCVRAIYFIVSGSTPKVLICSIMMENVAPVPPSMSKSFLSQRQVGGKIGRSQLKEMGCYLNWFMFFGIHFIPSPSCNSALSFRIAGLFADSLFLFAFLLKNKKGHGYLPWPYF